MDCSSAAACTADGGPRVVAYTEMSDPALEVALRVACADGIVDKQSAPRSCSRRCAWSPAAAPRSRRSRRAARAPPPRGSRATTSRCSRCSLDRTPAADVRDTLKLDPRRFTRRVERLLGRLRPRRSTLPIRGLSSAVG